MYNPEVDPANWFISVRDTFKWKRERTHPQNWWFEQVDQEGPALRVALRDPCE